MTNPRVVRAREAMATRGIDRLLLSVGPDMPYLIGYEAMALERLTMLIVDHENDPVLVIPELETPRVEPGSVDIIPWGEVDDPIDLVVARCKPGETIALGDHTWARFVLALQDRVEAEWVPSSPVMTELRIRKDPEELDLLRSAAQAADQVADRLATLTFSGMSERQLSRWIDDAVVEEGSDAPGFSLVASGPNGASPHHDSGDRVMEPGDVVVCDFGGLVGGYPADTTRTFVIGEPGAEQTGVHALVLSAVEAATAAVGPGVAAEEIDGIARTVITEGGFGEYFIHRTGHGIGREGHEEPYIVEGNDTPLEPTMCFSIEPGIYLPDRFGVRIEDIVTVTDDGVEVFNTSDRSLRIVG